jgi:hypothetical protein
MSAREGRTLWRLASPYTSPDIIRVVKSRRMRWAGHSARMGDMRNTYGIFIRKPEGKRPRGRPRRRWECNSRMNLRERGWEGVDWMHLARDMDPVGGSRGDGNESLGFIKGREFLDWLNDY